MYISVDNFTLLYFIVLYCIAARRKYSIELGAPWGSISVEKNMPSIKFYHDLSASMFVVYEHFPTFSELCAEEL